MHIRRLEAHEIGLHRELRLRALQNAPDSFVENFEDATARPLSYWETLTRAVTEAGRHAMFVACEGKTGHGSSYGLLDAERSDAGHVGGMWVDPASRRQGVGQALLQAVVVWARGLGLKHLSLWAPAHSAAAVGLYRRAGFQETGRRRPLPTNPALQIIEMGRDL